MEHWQCFSVLLLFFLVASSSQNCSVKHGIEGSTCICEPATNGWFYTCFDSHFSEPFAVKYQVELSLTFQCGEYEPPYQSIFHPVIFDGIKKYVFQSCPLPNASFSEIIPYSGKYPVEQITIERKRDNRSLTPELFGNFSNSLKRLILNNNNLDSIQENLFDNFTSLRTLLLSDNKLSSLPGGIFSNVENLVLLEIANNVLESLPEGIFDNLINLEKLYLYKNKLRELPPGIFKNLINLQVLDLSNNHLTVLPNGLIHGLTQLTSVRLNANWLVEISEDLFNTTYNLKEIDLKLNKFIEPLPEQLFFGLPQLETIIISDCNLSKIHENFFSQCPNLTNLNLERNSLNSLPQNIFLNNPLLKELDLNFNDLHEFPSNLFPNQMQLEVLRVFQNKISSIPDGMFKRARKVKILQLGENRIQNASQSMFRDLPNLEELGLNKNNLTHFELDVNEFIRKIDLSFNSLSEMPLMQWTRHLKIEEFNLSNNKLNSLTIPLVYPTKRSPILNFSNNKIRKVNARDVSIYDETLKELPPKDYESYVETVVDLRNNPFVCDCQIYNLFQYYKQSSVLPKKSIRFFSVQNLTCSEPQNLAGESIMSLSPSQFTCELLEQCSLPCHCYTRAQDNANIVNCSYHKLKYLPSEIPNNTNILYFNNNALHSMVGFNSSIFENLTELYIENNGIESLDDWDVPLKLSNLSLEGNLIKQLPSSLMKFISEKEQFQITLSKNPWTCNCSTKNFKKWLSNNYIFIRDVKKVICDNRIKVNGTFIRSPIVTTPDEAICPIDDWPYKLHLITVTVICVVLALLLFIVSVLYYRNKQVVIAYVYIHMHNVFNCFFSEEDMDEDKVFDAFVSYSSYDREVAVKLLEELEEKDKRFKLCIADRNWIAGNQISVNIFNSVYHSKRTILVVSKAFLESMWFQVEFRTAYCQMLEDKIDRLIIIVKGELPPKDALDKDLQFLLSTKTYLVWGEKWFWEKLKYAMPHKRRQALPNDVLALKDRPASEKIRAVDNQIAILSSGGNKTSDKVQEVIHNHTNSAKTAVKKDNPSRKGVML